MLEAGGQAESALPMLRVEHTFAQRVRAGELNVHEEKEKAWIYN
jgi:hypothetical protein